MANDLPDDGTPAPLRPSPAEARAALSGLGEDDARLAERAVMPRWYHLTLGTIVALIVVTQALPFPGSLVTLPLAIFALPALVVTYRRRYGVWFGEPAGPRSRRLFRVMVWAAVLAFAGALVVRFTEVPYAWALLPAVLGVAAAVVLGPRYDDAFREELAGRGRGDA